MTRYFAALFLLAGLSTEAASLSDLSYRTINGALIITDCSQDAAGELIVPATIEGNPVSAIGSNAFRECRLLTNVVISDGITSIHNHAFRNCQGLKSLSIPDSVEVIGDYAFNWCVELEEITLPNYLTSIGYYVFNGCASLTSLAIPAGVTSIQSTAFINCGRLRELRFLGNAPDNVPSSAFAEFSSEAVAIIYDHASGFSDTIGVLPVIIEPAPIVPPTRFVNGRFLIEIDLNTIESLTCQYTVDVQTWTTVENTRVFLNHLIVPLDSPALSGKAGLFRFVPKDSP
ncbi:MAG: leucine-rich repeat domain-containing protein [Verrucomicrobiaceae bacterium]